MRLSCIILALVLVQVQCKKRQQNQEGQHHQNQQHHQENQQHHQNQQNHQQNQNHQHNQNQQNHQHNQNQQQNHHNSQSQSSHSNAASSVPGNSNPAASLFTRLPPLPSPPLIEEEKTPPGPEEKPPPEGNPPLGLQKLILILVPQFKMKIKKTPKWWGASVKLSMPITVFFDKLRVPPNSPPLVLFPFGPVVPAKRVKRNAENDSILSLPPPESVKGGERAILVPRVEKMLTSYGLQGRGCLLRAVCEVHQAPLVSAYGFMGEIITSLFSISNSPYAKSHLREYLMAEDMGKAGMCSSYYRNCTESILVHHDDDD